MLLYPQQSIIPQLHIEDELIWDCVQLRKGRKSKKYYRLHRTSKRDLALQNLPLSKQPFKMQPQIGFEDIT